MFALIEAVSAVRVDFYDFYFNYIRTVILAASFAAVVIYLINTVVKRIQFERAVNCIPNIPRKYWWLGNFDVVQSGIKRGLEPGEGKFSDKKTGIFPNCSSKLAFVESVLGVFEIKPYVSQEKLVVCWMGSEVSKIKRLNISVMFNFKLIAMHAKAIVFARSAVGTEAILSSNKLIDKAMFYDFMYTWLGHGLLTRLVAIVG